MSVRPGVPLHADRRLTRGLAAWLLITAVCGCGDGPRAGMDPGPPCMQDDDCAPHEFCQWAAPPACGRDHAEGNCLAFDEQKVCPALAYIVCGCDGETYTNQCFSDNSGVAVDYGGPCRPAGIYMACSTADDCPGMDKACVDDPRDSCVPGGNTACPGVCVDASYVCSEALACASATTTTMTTTSDIRSPGTEACVAIIGCTDSNCEPGRCVYTTRATCASPADCGEGELCLPTLGCAAGAGSCPGVCARP
jgi:hypothetical protein